MSLYIRYSFFTVEFQGSGLATEQKSKHVNEMSTPSHATFPKVELESKDKAVLTSNHGVLSDHNKKYILKMHLHKNVNVSLYCMGMFL